MKDIGCTVVKRAVITVTDHAAVKVSSDLFKIRNVVVDNKCSILWK